MKVKTPFAEFRNDDNLWVDIAMIGIEFFWLAHEGIGFRICDEDGRVYITVDDAIAFFVRWISWEEDDENAVASDEVLLEALRQAKKNHEAGKIDYNS